jgi:hypothetical protein
MSDEELDEARRAGPHSPACPVWDEDPDGIDRCPCPDGAR